MLNIAIELDEHKELREFYEHQQDLFAYRIAHSFLLANDYCYNDVFYEKELPKF